MSDEQPFDEIVEQILEWPELADVKKELEDPRFATRSHGSRGTYALKCRGPLCKYAERVRGNKRYATKISKKEGREVAIRERQYNRDDLYAALAAWHKKQMALRRLEASA